MARRSVLADWFPDGSHESFLHDDFGKRVAHVSGNRERFADLLTAEEFLRNAHACARSDSDTFRFGGRSLRDDQAQYSRLFLEAARNRTVWSSLDELASDCASGLTLIFNQLYHFNKKVDGLSKRMLHEFGEFTGANAYFSPASGKLGLGWHYDCWDVFVLQIAGAKRWYYSEDGNILPVERMDFGAPEPEIEHETIEEVLLEQGALLYLPRGTWHRPITVDEHSLHLTVGIHRRAHLHFNSWIFHELSQNPDLRAFLPLDPFGSPTSGKLDEELAGALGAYSDEVARLLTGPGALSRYRIFCLQSANKRMNDGRPELSEDEP